MQRLFFAFPLVLFLLILKGTVLNSQVLIRIENKEISSSEFERLYKKNMSVAGEISLEEYLDLYIDFQLKVYDAEKNLLHEETSFLNEFKMYRQQLARPFLTHVPTEELFLKEAYERLQQDIHASHILVRMEPGTQPADTLLAWEKAIRMREQILAGEEFEAVARRASDDPSAKFNSGEIGYFTAFQMVYPFEKAAYELPVGEVSLPVRSRFGYHLIRVNDKRKAAGEVKLQHILLRLPAEAGDHSIMEVKEKAETIYRRIQNGEDFGQLAREYSQDMASAANNGEMNWFGTGSMIPEFEKVAFALKRKGDVSEPFLTQYGWHIVKLTDKREVSGYQSVKDELREKLYSAGDERSYFIRNNFLEDLKKEYDFREEPGNLEYFLNLPESWFTGETGPAVFNQIYGKPLFYIQNNPCTGNEFASFLRINSRFVPAKEIRNFVSLQYKDFVAVKLMEREEQNLEKKYPEFRYIVKEYYDGLLLFEITERKIWSRAVSDSAGLEKYFSDNRKNFMSKEKMDASIFYFRSGRDLAEAHRLASRNTRRKYSEQSVVNILNRNIGEKNWTLERKVFSIEEFPLSGNIAWKKGLSDGIQVQDNNVFFFVHSVVKPEPLPLDEIRGLVISRFQEKMEREWVEKLKKDYSVKVDKEVLSELIRKFKPKL